MELTGALAKSDDLRSRTKKFSLRVLKLFRSLPKDDDGRIIGRQVLRSAMSVGANYRAVGRSRSRKEFISKMNTVVEEADETVFWFEIIVEGGLVPATKMKALLREGNELLAIFSASLRTAKFTANQAKSRPAPAKAAPARPQP